MASLTFPDSPSNNDTYAAENGITYTYLVDKWAATLNPLPIATEDATITWVIDGGGAAIETGVSGYLEVTFACTINRVTTLLDQSGSIVVDIWKDIYSSYPPVDADSITASAPPTVTTDTDSQDATLTGWTTAIAAGDILGFNVDSITTAEKCTVSLKVTKT